MEYTDFELITGILNWSDVNPKFNTDFVMSVSDFYEEQNYISDSQRAALENIVSQWKIHLDKFID
jgi:hypothetical protein